MVFDIIQSCATIATILEHFHHLQKKPRTSQQSLSVLPSTTPGKITG